MNPYKEPIWVWLKQNFTPKRYQSETQKQRISFNEFNSNKDKSLCKPVFILNAIQLAVAPLKGTDSSFEHSKRYQNPGF